MKRNRLAVNFYFFLNGFIYANWIARLLSIQEIYQIDNGQTGMILLTHAIGALVAMPLAGWLIVKNGSQSITIASAFLYCLFVPFLPLMGTIGLLSVLLFTTGFSTGVMDVAMNAQAVLVEEKYEKPIMSSFHAVFSGGMMIGAGTCSIFTDWGISLLIHLLIVTGLSLLLAIWASFNLIKDRPTAKLSDESTGFQLPSKSLWGIGIIAFCCMLGEGAMADWSTIYMKNIALSSEALAPIGLGAFSTSMMVGRIFGDRGRIIFGDQRLLVINSIIATFGIAIIILFPNPVMVIIGLFLAGLGLSVIVPIAYSTAGALKELPPGVGISMVTTIGYSGFLFGPPIIGFLADWKTLWEAMFFVALLFLLMLLLTIYHKVKNNAV